MDGDSPNKSPGSNIDDEETGELLFADWDMSTENVDCLEQVSRDVHQQEQHQQASASSAPLPLSDLPAAIADASSGNRIPDHEYDGWVEQLSQDLPQQGQDQNFQASATPALAPPIHLPAVPLTDALGGNEKSDDWDVKLQDLWASHYPAVQPNQSSQSPALSTRSDLPTIMVTDPLGENQPPVEPSVADILPSNQPVQEQLQHQNLSTQTFRYLQHNPLPATMPDQTFLQSQIHGCQPAESNPELTVTFDELDELLKKFKEKKDKENPKLAEVTSLLSDRLGEKIPDTWVSEFQSFDIFFKNLCRLRRVLERWMANYEEIRSTTNLSPSEILDLQIATSRDPTVRYLDEIVFKPAAEQIAARNSNLLRDRPGCSTWKVTAHQESSVVFDTERNVVNPANQFYEGKLPCDKYVKTPTKNRRIPISPARKNCGDDDDDYVYSYLDAKKPASLRSPSQKLFFEKVRPEEMMPLQEIVDFVEYFKSWRMKRGLSQDQVQSTLLKICERRDKGDMIFQLESLRKFLLLACKLKTILENWLNEIHVPRSEPE